MKEEDEIDEKIGRAEKELFILQSTAKYLEEAKDRLTARYLGGTKRHFLDYVAQIGEDAGEFSMDTSFTVTKIERGATRKTDFYSKGTRDLYALAARFALVDSLYEGEKPLLILDDPFAHFDDFRFAKAKETLQKFADKRQVLYLTCTNARSVIPSENAL